MIYFVTNQLRIFQAGGIKCLTYEDFKSQYMKQYLLPMKIIGIDTETEGFDPHTKNILCIQIGDKHNQFVLDRQGLPQWFIEFLKVYLDNTRLCIFQNAKFDLKFLYKLNIVPRLIYDTYLAESILTKGIERERKSLDYLCQKYLKIHLDKTIRGNIHKEGLTDRVVKYAADDIVYLEEIRTKQLKHIHEKGLNRDLDLENDFVKSLAYMEYCGIFLNTEKWSSKMKDDLKLRVEKEEALNQFICNNPQEFDKFIEKQLDLFSTDVKSNVNWSSPKQVIPLFHQLGLDTKVKDKKSGKLKDSVEASVLESQVSKHPIVPKYLEFKGAEKVVTTYGQSFLDQINPVTGRIHTNFTQIMNSGRISSGGKDKQNKTQYINLQNIPADDITRSCFEGQNKNTLIVSDYSSQEIVCLTNLSQEPKLLEFFNSGNTDFHSFVAKQVYPELRDLTLEEIKKKHPDKRQIAKVAAFAIVYGATEVTIAAQCKIPIEDASYFYKMFFETFTGLKEYFESNQKQALTDGFVLIDKLTGSKCFIQYFDEFKENKKKLDRKFWDLYKVEKANETPKFLNELKPLVRKVFSKEGEIKRIATNYRIQGTSSRITKTACILLFNKIFESGQLHKVLIPNCVHDEIVVECSPDIADYWKDVTRECMELAGSYWCKTIPLKAEPSVTKVWKK